MEGYSPLPGMEGYGNYMQSGVTDAGRMAGGYTVDQGRMEAMAAIREVEDELARVNAELAELDRQNPGLRGMTDTQREIAAQRASIGDMSAYDSMVQRGNAGTQTANAIDNGLMDAEKLAWGLGAKNTEDQMAARNQIEVAMRKAERDAAQAGLDVTKIPSYQRLQAALAGNGMQNNNTLVNFYKWKLSNGTLTEEDRKYVDEVIRKDMNSSDFDSLFGFLKDSKGRTVEAKGKANAEKKEAQDAAAAWDKNRSVTEKKNAWNRLVQEKAPITKYYDLNDYGNPVPKGGAK